NGEFIDKKEPEEYDFSKRPRIDNSIVEAAFKQFESDPTPGNFDKILMDIKKKGQPSSRQPTSTAGTSSSLGVGSKLHVPTRKGSVSPVRASTRARTQNRRYSGNFELSGDEGSRGRQGKAASPSDRSDPADDDGDITVVGRKHRKTILDDSDDEDEDALPASPVRKKRKKGTDRSSAETAPKKKFRPTQQEQEVYTNTRASSAVQSHHRGSAPRLSGQALNDARIEQDGDGPDNDQAAQDECERRGFGAEETRKARAEAKDRQKDVVRAKNGRIQDWRYPALNEVQSITVLKYFDPVSKLEPSPGFIKSITWKCRCCHRTFTAAPGITTNLLGHLNAKPSRGPCPDRDTPLTKGVEPWIPSWAKDDESARVPEPAKGRDLDAMSQRSFMSKWTK
ncbi:hypothetical protein A4X03_0g6689, partial [Tilletia caries]